MSAKKSHKPVQKQRIAAPRSPSQSSPRPRAAVDAVGDAGWDDLDNLYLNCRAQSVLPAQVMPLLKDPAKLSLVKDTAELTNQARVLSKDVVLYNERLESIHSKHKDRRGSSASPDELMEIISLGEEYQTWLHSYSTVVLPTVNNILVIFAEAEEAQLAAAPVVEGEYIPATR